jgi:hypothetical protein
MAIAHVGFGRLGEELPEGAQAPDLFTDVTRGPPTPHLTEVEIHVFGQTIKDRPSGADDGDVNTVYQPLKPWQTRICYDPPRTSQ